jgi:cytochrome c-type biogenesis protein CcmH/NrfG
MVKTLRAHPLLKNAGAVPHDQSEYAFLMAKLPPDERVSVIRNAIRQAEDPKTNRLKINWAHLLLATLVDAGYINQILTTNFDPLIVEALAMTGQPVRAFDLTASAGFQAGALEPGSVVYLHGQAHGLWLSNSPDEMDRVRHDLNSVYQDALRDSILIVVGYSGACDPVLQELAQRFRQFRHYLYWVHHDGSTDPGDEAMSLLKEPYREAYLIKGLDADAFMRELVLEGLKLELPLIVKNPLDFASGNLGRVMPFPPEPGGPVGQDPVVSARKLVTDALAGLSNPKTAAPPASSQAATLQAVLPIAVSMAAATKSRAKLEELRPAVEQSANSAVQKEFGQAYLILASDEIESGNYAQALDDVGIAEKLGASEKQWIATMWGDVLTAQAQAKSGAEADALFQLAGEKYAQALRIKPDMHEALNNWGVALSDQARTKTGAEADALFQLAGEKYAQALRIKPDMHEALYNWGNALSDQARTKTGAEADALFQLAGEKYEQALRIKPDMHDALYNWGNALSDQAKTKTGAEADALFKLAGEKCEQALRIKPDNHEALYNWGNALSDQARTRSGSEADALFKLAGEKYEQALRIKPDYHQALCNWGNALADQAKTRTGAEADALFKLAAEKYEQALRIKPNKDEALNNWGAALSDQAQAKSGAEADALFKLAGEKYEQALRIKPDDREAMFNMACLFGLKNSAASAVPWLRKWAEGNPKATRAKIAADPDFDRIREDPLLRAFVESLPNP